MTLEQSIEEAQHLKSYLNNAYKQIYHMPEFKESEVQLRASALKNMLLVLQSDVYSMVEQWTDEKANLT